MACFYRAMMEELIASVKQTHSVPLKRTDPPEVVIAPTGTYMYFLLVWFTNDINNTKKVTARKETTIHP